MTLWTKLKQATSEGRLEFGPRHALVLALVAVAIAVAAALANL